ncbi:MAG: XdhC family protein [Micromonosporaceae bacterium]|nr:XdhC family protein [Micromonosporaceae bacterium]
MYDIAASVAACLRAGTRVDVAWAVQTDGFGDRREPSPGPSPTRVANEALAITPGGGRIGGVLRGSANPQLAELARDRSNRLVRVSVSEFEAQLAGLPAGGQALCLLVEATRMPAALWERLRRRDPICLVARLDGDQVTSVDLYDRDTVADAGEEAARLYGRGASDTLMTSDAVVTVLWPVPKLVIAGTGPIVDALRANAELLGWQVQVASEPSHATGLIAGLSALDNVVVASHDLELAGTALQAALTSEAGYIGALANRRTQQARADWLAYRGVTDLSRVHSPAGLDIGSRTPPEIAVAVLAEALAVRSGSPAAHLRDRSGPG